MGMVSMSSQEFSRLDVLLDASVGRITVEAAGQLIGLGRSQIFRLLRGFRAHGAASLISKRRGRPANNQISPAARDLEPTAQTRPLARKLVTVIDYPDGRIALRHNGADLPYRIFDKLQKVDQGAIVENKRLGAVLAHIAERQKELDITRSKKAPRRQGQAERHMFKTG